MQRLIDADALVLAVLKKAFDDAFLNGNTDMHRLLIQVIAHQPTVDAVPVIRCKDCYFYGTFQRKHCCTKYEHSIKQDGFCAWAELKGEKR